jgi:hypothetical protein
VDIVGEPMHPIALMQSIMIALEGAFAGVGVDWSAMTICAQSPSACIAAVADEDDNGIACTVAPMRKAKPVSASTKRLRTIIMSERK